MDWCLEPVRQTSDCPALPTTDTFTGATTEGSTGRGRHSSALRGPGHFQRDTKVCVRINGAGRRKTSETVTTFGATTRQIMAMRDHLVAQKVTCVVMEATGDYWKPFYYLLEDLAGVEVMLVNARHVKNLPGRKTDVADATWLAQLGAHGLIRGSFVPPQPIRELRDLTRTRTAVTRERTREIQRLEKLLEDAGIKLSSVAADLNGASSRASPGRVARRRNRSGGHGGSGQETTAQENPANHRSPRPSVQRPSRVSLTRMHLDLIDQHTAAIEALTERIEVVMEPFRCFRDLICTIPGIGGFTADVVVAETGADMTSFPTAQHLASWAGTTPGNNELAGRSNRGAPDPATPIYKAHSGPRRCRSHTPATPTWPPISPDRHPPWPPASQRRRSTRTARLNLEPRHNQHHLPSSWWGLLHPPQPPKSPKQRRPPTRSHGLPRHPRPGVMTEPLTPRTHLTSIFSSGMAKQKFTLMPGSITCVHASPLTSAGATVGDLHA